MVWQLQLILSENLITRDTDLDEVMLPINVVQILEKKMLEPIVIGSNVHQ